MRGKEYGDGTDPKGTVRLLDDLCKLGFDDEAFWRLHHKKEVGKKETIRGFRKYCVGTRRFREFDTNCFVHRRLFCCFVRDYQVRQMHSRPWLKTPINRSSREIRAKAHRKKFGIEFRVASTFTATFARLAGSEPALRAGKTQNWQSSGRAPWFWLELMTRERSMSWTPRAAAAARRRRASCRRLLQRFTKRNAPQEHNPSELRREPRRKPP